MYVEPVGLDDIVPLVTALFGVFAPIILYTAGALVVLFFLRMVVRYVNVAESGADTDIVAAEVASFPVRSSSSRLYYDDDNGRCYFCNRLLPDDAIECPRCGGGV